MQPFVKGGLLSSGYQKQTYLSPPCADGKIIAKAFACVKVSVGQRGETVFSRFFFGPVLAFRPCACYAEKDFCSREGVPSPGKRRCRQMNEINSSKGRLGIIVSMLIFGTIGIFRRWIPLSSSVVALVRAVVGTLALALFMLVARKKPDWKGIGRQWYLLITSGLLIGFNWIALFEAYNYTTVSVATLSYYMAPVIIVLASPLLFGEKLTVKSGLCVLCALVGLVLISGVLGDGITGMKGILFGLAAAAMYASVVLINKRIHGISGLDRTMVQLLVSAVTLLPYVLLTEKNTGEPLTGNVLLLLLVVGVVHTGIAYLMYFSSVEKVPAQTAALCSYIDPAASLILSAVLLGERMDVWGLIGTAMILGSAIVAEWPRKTAKG